MDRTEATDTGWAADSGAVEPLETFAELREMAARKGALIPPEELARQILRVTKGADWPVRRAAMDALLRRLEFARRDELRVDRRPRGGKRLGEYTTRVPGRNGRRPYRTLMRSLDPISGSCDCRDFVRSSLGLCKHLLVVLADIHGSERKLAQARKERALRPGAPLRWDPVRPLDGRGDWLDRVRWCADGDGAPSKAAGRARSAFAASTGKLKRTYPDDPEKRLALVEILLSALPRAKGRAATPFPLGTPSAPALSAVLARERIELRTRLAARALVKQPRSWMCSLKRTLYPYQQDGVRRFLETGRLLLGDDMGLGKTTQAVAACHALFAGGQVRRGLVIAPASLKWQWLREWQGVTDVPAEIVDGSPGQRREQYRSLRRGFLIMNYELLLRDMAMVREIDPDVVVLDEAQRIKNWATKTAALVKSLRVPYRLVLTGTPMENRLEELASIYDWVDDMALEPKWRLVPWHAIHAQEGQRGEIVGARNLDTLRQRIADTFVRRIRRDVLGQLPPRTDTRVPVPLTDQQLVAHSDFDQPIAQLVGIAKRRPLLQREFLRLMSMLTTQRIICNGMAQYEFERIWPSLPRTGPNSSLQLQGLFAPKLAELRRLVEELVVDQSRKVVIFSQWRRMIRLASWAITDLLARRNQRAVYFTGAETPRQRTRGVVELHDDPHTTVMFLTDAGGVGLNLQRAASACINLELPWNPAVLEQRVSRIYRIGQDQPVDIYNLVSESGIEARIANIVGAKKELFTGLFDGTTDEIVFSGASSAISQIERLIDPPQLPMPPSNGAGPDDGELDDTGDLRDMDLGDDRSDTDLGEDRSDADLGVDRSDRGTPAPAAARATGAAAAASSAISPASTGAGALAASRQDVQRLLTSLSVRSTPSGGIAIEAPPEAAQTLASLFGAMAKLLEQQPPR
jgi:hypothetical protein